ncbi:MAG TPA: polymer-forming cytoskeletal protein [Chthoniobacteraceae bacterium]|jgi:cytoskeletal protein CcmA (bactofilin family)
MTSTTNTLSADVEIKGKVKLGNETHLDGRIEGEVHSSGSLVVRPNGSVQGDIHAKSVTIFGKVTGNVTVSERCELKSEGHLIGDLKSPRLIIEDGATYIGQSHVSPHGNA